METEIKLLLDPSQRGAVESHPLFAAASPRIERNATTYFDTPDLALREKRLSLRVRHAGDAYVQTVKTASSPESRDALSRGEWEWRVAAEAIDPDPILAVPALRHLLDGDLLGRVRPVFTTEVERTARRFAIDGATEIEAAIDQGLARAGERTEAICEVELELKKGPAAPLFRLAREMSGRAGLRLGPQSKAERGYGLLTAAPPPKTDASDLTLPPEVRISEAFPMMLAASTRDLVADLSSAAGGDVEGVHRLRAAVRKLRTLLVLFDGRLEPGGAARFNAMLRDFGRILGHGRDWDVFATETLPAAREALGLDLAALQAAGQARRAEAHAEIRRAVERSSSPTELVLDMSAWTADTGWRREEQDDDRLHDALPDMLAALARKVAKRGRHIESLDDTERHRLRKSLKKLRYAAEDVASLFKHRAVKDYVRRCKDVLEVLGTVNDAAVTTEYVRALAAGDGADLRVPADAVLGWNEKRAERALRKLDRRWSHFRAAEPFWH